MLENSSSLIFAHIGDLHLTTAKEQNYKDLLSIIADIETGAASNIDFVYLPGDNADHGEAHTYKLLSTALKMLSVPIYVISGDHDMETRSLNNLYALQPAKQMPFALNVNGVSCLFLDVCGHGTGGPDFRLGAEQRKWLNDEVQKASSAKKTIVLFMHTFPEDLKDENEKSFFNNLISKNNVALVDMGHTHYNEIANDGNTIYTATRSTGQVEEGPVGYSLISVYDNAVSWRFKLLDEPFPFVLITYPGDYRLATKQSGQNKIQEIRAVVISDKKIIQVNCTVNNNQKFFMFFSESEHCWIAPVDLIDEKPVAITVMATDETGRPGIHTITYSARPKEISSTGFKAGSDDFRLGAWPENHVFGTQLGPNRNAKPAHKP